MDGIAFRYRHMRLKYPEASEREIWHGVAVDFYMRTGQVPRDVLIRSALARADGYGYKYRPDQLRVPAGNPDGGQWTDEGGGGGASTRDRVARNKPSKDKKPIASDAPAQPVRATDSSPRMLDEVIDKEPSPFDGAEITPAADRWGYNIDLTEEERGTPTSRRGHAIERHVGKTREEIFKRIIEEKYFNGYMYDYPIIGTFQGLYEANLYVNEALRRQSTLVEAVKRGEFGNSPKWIIQDIGLPTRREGEFDGVSLTFNVTRAAKVSIQRANNKNGFRVITAYPSNIRSR